MTPINDDPVGRSQRARDWESTAALAWLVSVCAVAWAAFDDPRWAKGDVIVAVYFATLGLGFWAQAQRVRNARSTAPFTTAVAVVFTVGLLMGLLLIGAALGTAGAV